MRTIYADYLKTGRIVAKEIPNNGNSEIEFRDWDGFRDYCIQNYSEKIKINVVCWTASSDKINNIKEKKEGLEKEIGGNGLNI